MPLVYNCIYYINNLRSMTSHRQYSNYTNNLFNNIINMRYNIEYRENRNKNVTEIKSLQYQPYKNFFKHKTIFK